jgi:hypothetical protein
VSASTVTLKYLLLGEAGSAVKAMKTTGGAADETGGKLHGMATKTNVALLAVTGAAVAFGTQAVDTFKNVGAETNTLRRAIGGTAEDSSRLIFAAQESGVGFETLNKSTGKLEKSLYTATGTAKTNAAMIKLLGFNYRDAHGNILPMSVLIPKLADKLAKMPAGAEKTGLAMRLFGKAGADMLPFLNKGSSGIAALTKESDKFGDTLTGKNLAALAKSKAGQREWNASMEGLKIQVGAQLLPIMNTFISFIRDHVIPVVEAVTGFIKEHGTAVATAAVIIGTIIVGMKAWAIATGILNAVMAMNPIALVVIALVALAAGLIMAYKHSATFRAIVQEAFHAVGAAVAFVWGIIHPIFNLWLAQFKILWAAAQFMGSVISGAVGFIGRAFGTAYRDVSGWIRSIIGAVTGIPGHIAAAAGGMLRAGANLMDALWRGLKSAVGGAGDFARGIINDIIDGLNAILPHSAGFSIMGHHVGIPLFPMIPHLATGGPVQAGMPYVVGDGGRSELFVPNQSGYVHPSVPSSGGAGGATVINISFGHGMALATRTEIGREIAAALEYAARAGTKLNIKQAIA